MTDSNPRPGSVRIGKRWVGPGSPCLIVAEAGVNHDGEVSRAEQLVDAAAEAGADVVKFQTFQADRVLSPRADKAAYQKSSGPAGETQLEMARRLELPPGAFATLAARAIRRGIGFWSTPFDADSARLLVGLGVDAIKVSSGDLTHLPFLADLASLGRPLVVSTGMATLEEVATAVGVVREAGDPGLVLLHCTSSYPCPAGDANLRAMATLATAFGVPVGYSDHTEGIAVALAAAALGACLIEKHFTLDRDLPGPDHRASIEPDQLAALVRGVRRVEAALGHGRKEPTASEADTARVARRSLVAAHDLAAGSVLVEDMIAILRPGTGLAPGRLAEVLGRRLRAAVPAGRPLRAEDLE